MESRLLLFIFLNILQSGRAEMRVVDLTHGMSDTSVIWPGNPGYNFTTLYRDWSGDRKYWYEANYFGTPEHVGTHVDAPAHFAEGAWRTQQIPMEKLVGPGVVIDVKSKASANPDYRVMTSDLQQWETEYGRIPNKAIVLMNSGWSEKHPNKTKIFNTESHDDPSTFHFPGFHEVAAEWLVNNRHIHVLGVDTPSNDYGQSTTFPTHIILGKAFIPGVENVANLDQIPQSGATVYVAVTKIVDGSGGPARVFATFDDNPTTAFSPTHRASLIICIFYVICAHQLFRLT